MGFLHGGGIMLPVQVVRSPLQTVTCILTAALLAAGTPFRAEAKSYGSGGGHSYSSHSSSSHSSGSHSSSGSRSGGSHSFSSGSGHTFSSGGSRSSSGSSTRSSSSGSSATRTSSSGGSSPSRSATSTSSSSSERGRSTSESPSRSKSFTSGSGKSYGSGSTFGDSGRHSYTSGKSYSSGARHTFSSSSTDEPAAVAASSSRSSEPAAVSPAFTFDQAAARARKEEASKAQFTQFKDSQRPPPVEPAAVAQTPAPPSPPPPAAETASYRVKPPPIPASQPPIYLPDNTTLATRPARTYSVFNPYASRPVVIYRDPYSSLFWWWLLDRSLDDRASWAYHHRYDMDPSRYQALVAQDAQLEARVQQLEAQQTPRDTSYVPPGVQRDLMYSDHYVQRTYSNRPTTSGVVAFWILAVPLALGVAAFFIWLIWFKRWQTAT